MNTRAGHAGGRGDGRAGGRGDGRAGTAAARAVVLVRHRQAGRAEGEVHLVPLPLCCDTAQPDSVSGLCGRRLRIDDIETVRPGEGVWCTGCFVSHVTGRPAVPSPARFPERTAITDAATSGTVTVAERLAAGVAYRALGWPVTLQRTEVSLNLDLDVDAVAVVIPAVLATEVVEVLLRRRCPPPVLVHPALPAHRVIVAGNRFPVPLGWPTGVHRVTGTLLLPPSVTAHGPVCWVRPPVPDALQLCREIDVIAALRAALGKASSTS